MCQTRFRPDLLILLGVIQGNKRDTVLFNCTRGKNATTITTYRDDLMTGAINDVAVLLAKVLRHWCCHDNRSRRHSAAMTTRSADDDGVVMTMTIANDDFTVTSRLLDASQRISARPSRLERWAILSRRSTVCRGIIDPNTEVRVQPHSESMTSRTDDHIFNEDSASLFDHCSPQPTSCCRDLPSAAHIFRRRRISECDEISQAGVTSPGGRQSRYPGWPLPGYDVNSR